MKLTDLPNLGKVTAAKLQQKGVENAEQLKQLGTEKAFMLLREDDPGTCINLLYGLDAAISGVKKASLPAERREYLKSFLKSLG